MKYDEYDDNEKIKKIKEIKKLLRPYTEKWFFKKLREIKSLKEYNTAFFSDKRKSTINIESDFNSDRIHVYNKILVTKDDDIYSIRREIEDTFLYIFTKFKGIKKDSQDINIRGYDVTVFNDFEQKKDIISISIYTRIYLIERNGLMYESAMNREKYE
jgi:hypothetical protein